MNSLQKTFLSAIKTTLWNTSFEPEDGVTPEELYREASRYEIVGVLSDKLDLFCNDDINIRSVWSEKAVSDYRKSLYVLYAQRSLNKILGQKGIKPIILKGMASAWYYPEPLLRYNGDIDFMVLPEQFDTCRRLLHQNGYEEYGKDGRHLKFKKQGIDYECHRYFSYYKTDADKMVDSIIYSGCRNCTVSVIEDKEFYTLPGPEYGIVLLEHLKYHLVDGVGFRQIIDWVVYADAVLDDEMWHNTFQKMAKECGLERLAKTVTRTAQLYLGLNTKKISWCRDIDDNICAALIEMIFSCNNFGFISEDGDNLHAVGNIFRYGFFSRFDSRAVAYVPIAERIAILRPIAWLYLVLRWIYKGVVGLFIVDKRIKITPKEWKSQKELLKQIGV